MTKPAADGFTRRYALSGGLAGLACLALPAFAAGSGLWLHPDRGIAHMPVDFTGLSVEKAQLSDPVYFSSTNKSLIAFFRRLSPHGVLRLGGNSSDFCLWNPVGRVAPPGARGALPGGRGALPEGQGALPEGQSSPKVKAYDGRKPLWVPQNFTQVGPVAADALKGFLDACGWRCIWGFNLGTATPEENAAEAAYVAKVLGSRVKYFQIGNEPDFYAKPNNRLRPAGWGFDDYLQEWRAHARAVLKAVPAAKFGGPDVGASSEWVIRFARAAKPFMGAHLTELTGHYYAAGPPQAKWVSIASLLKSNNAAARRMAKIRPVADGLGLGYRMSEGNSCYRGGKAGMSDAFAAALWGGDYMLAMAAAGCAGVNLHCGSGAVIAHSLGGNLPGARNGADLERAKLGAFYAPVAGNRQAGFNARPLYYGMMLAEQFAGSDLVALSANFAGVNGSAWAGIRDGMLRIAIFNKDLQRDLRVPVDIGRKVSGIARQWRLTGPAPEALSGVTFAGSAVARRTADWTVRQQGYVRFHDGFGRIFVPRASAQLFLLPV